MKSIYVLIMAMLPFTANSQEEIEWFDELALEEIRPNTKKKIWLKMIENGMSQPINIPVIIIKGDVQEPVLGLIAAIHGNELNGIKVIQELTKDINENEFKGTLVAIPGINGISITQHRRRYIDEEDLNRNFPGKEQGNRSQQYVWQINHKILSELDYLVDMHTASFGRENSLYVRAKLDEEEIAQMARLQDADIVLNSSGLPSAGKQTRVRTMRAEAMLKGIPSITVEYGNPQVYQTDIIKRGVKGIKNLMRWLKMIEGRTEKVNEVTYCKKSYWIYVREGGYLEILVNLNQKIKKGDLIAIMRNPFGDILNEYRCPEDGIVIGKSSNPINMNGGRILHLGIIDESLK